MHIPTSVPGYSCDKTVNRREKNGNLLTISRPTVIKLYNQYMGGVDISDQRVATYRRHMKRLTWYLQLFHHMFRLSVIQSYIIIAVGRMRQRLPSFPVLFYGVSPYISL